MNIKNVLIRKMLENRGYTDEYLYDINNPDHDSLKDVDECCAELKDIHDSGQVLTVLPDFDMDGVASGSCFYAGLAELGFNVRLFVPDPSKGYGITVEIINDALQMHPDTQVFITCDTGIDRNEEADYCHSKGIRFLVTDHHKQQTESTADIVVDPMRMDETYEHPWICGAFVVYQILQRYADLYTNAYMQDQIRRLRVFAGIGTVSDTMPVLYENRAIVRDAVDICRLIFGDGSNASVSAIRGCDVYRRAFWGIYEFLKAYERYGVIKSNESINEEFFGFHFAPAINSIKRMDGDMVRAFSLFFGNDRAGDVEYLYNLNNERKIEVSNAIAKIQSMQQPFAPYIYYSDARAGILGLIAQKLFSDSGTVTLVLNSDGTGFYGSGRSPEWYPCITRLSAFFKKIAGHEASFGCSVADYDQLTALYEHIAKDFPEVMSTVNIAEEKPDYVISPDWKADCGIDIDVFEDYINNIQSYRPFGKGFPAPSGVFRFTNRDVLDQNSSKKPGWEVMGKSKNHLKIHFANGFDAICWNQAHLITQKDSFDEHEIVGDLQFSEFMGVRSVVFVGTLVER